MRAAFLCDVTSVRDERGEVFHDRWWDVCILTKETAQVLQVLPIFEAPTPAEGALPHAYPHCPMAMVGIRVWKPKARLLLSLSFGSTPGSIGLHACERETMRHRPRHRQSE